VEEHEAARDVFIKARAGRGIAWARGENSLRVSSDSATNSAVGASPNRPMNFRSAESASPDVAGGAVEPKGARNKGRAPAPSKAGKSSRWEARVPPRDFERLAAVEAYRGELLYTQVHTYVCVYIEWRQSREPSSHRQKNAQSHSAGRISRKEGGNEPGRGEL
jgi:hypothetical protein